MTAFEKWQVVNMSLQTAFLLLTFLGALYVGFKQNEINQHLLNAQLFPSPEVTFNHSTKQIELHNKGQANLFLCGSSFQGVQSIETDDRLVVPGSFYYIPGENLIQIIKSKLGNFPDGRFPLDLFIKGSDGRTYQIQNELFCLQKGTDLEIRFQTLAIVPAKWK